MTGPSPRLAAGDLARLRDKTVLITGTAGFIGFAVADALLDAGVEVVGIDNLCAAYYPRVLKDARTAHLSRHEAYVFHGCDLCDDSAVAEVVARHRPGLVLHLAAHASVLPSFDAPIDYMRSNVLGTQSLLEAVRQAPWVEGLVYASTSSVYGRSKDGATPFHEDMPVDTPISVYGASKIANEAMMQAYAQHYGLAVTGLHNFGEIHHAFTYVDDVVAGTVAALARLRPPEKDFRHPVYNLGNPSSQDLDHCVGIIERALGVEAVRELVDLPAGDRTFSRADISRAERDLDYRVATDVDEGIPRFVTWYRDVYAPLMEGQGPLAAAAAPG
jgi:UDP-glucuronate 4-epimerase